MKGMLLSGFVLAGVVLLGGNGVRAQAPGAGSAAPESAGTLPDGLQPGGSQVRIVRLSMARGSVQMDRNTGRGFEGAFANIPVVAGAKLRTADGVAEVEFEDNSSLRMAPGTEVLFSQLARTSAGMTLTTVQVVKGLAYVSMQKDKNAGEFTLTNGDARVVLSPGTHVRLDATGPQVELAVFDGSAQVGMGTATATVAKRQTVTLNPAANTMGAVQKGTEEASWDEWDKAQTDYHKGVATFAGSAGGFGLYGVNDLGYYGSFADLPGCGNVWRPYFASAGWDPFANGIWAWYPSAGYSWVSPYPWGWLPYHSGSWAQCGASGWGWRPGGTWVGLTNHRLMSIAHHPNPHPVPPTPIRGAATLVPVNTRPLTMSGISEKGFAFRQDSAGLGVPRAQFGKLSGVSTHVEQHGEAVSSVGPSGFGEPGLARGTSSAGVGRSQAAGGGGRSYSPSSSSGSVSSSHSAGMGSMSSAGPSTGASGGSGGGGHH